MELPEISEGFVIEPIDLEREVNYAVFNKSGYICRLIPGRNGFELSKLDLCLGNLVPAHFVSYIGNLILNQDA